MAKENRNTFLVGNAVINNPFSKNNTNTTRVDDLLHPDREFVSMEILTALEIVVKQMRNCGLRERTIHDYVKWTKDYADCTNSLFLSDINLQNIYEWFDSMDVQNTTKKIRFKSLSAVLGRFYDNGWLQKKFWKTINFRVDETIKKPAKWEDIEKLLGILDLNNFFQLRDACAILMMWQTGVRIKTLSLLKENNVDFDNKLLLLDGVIMKNHKFAKMPLGEELVQLLRILIQQNTVVRARNKQSNRLLFITQRGNSIQKHDNGNAIRKQLVKYSDKFGIENINPHAIRRGYALNLLKQGASVALISKALTHSDISVTTKYLYLDNEETLSELRKYL